MPRWEPEAPPLAHAQVELQPAAVPLGLLLRLANVQQQQISESVGPRLQPAGLARLLTVAVEQPRGNVPRRQEDGVGVAHRRCPVDRLRGAYAADPNGRVRLLIRLRPDVDITILVVFAFPGERLGGRP